MQKAFCNKKKRRAISDSPLKHPPFCSRTILLIAITSENLRGLDN